MKFQNRDGRYDFFFNLFKFSHREDRESIRPNWEIPWKPTKNALKKGSGANNRHGWVT